MLRSNSLTVPRQRGQLPPLGDCGFRSYPLAVEAALLEFGFAFLFLFFRFVRPHKAASNTLTDTVPIAQRFKLWRFTALKSMSV